MWQSRSLAIALIALLTFFSVHVVYRLLDGVRSDLTADDLYSLTEGTQEILEKMKREGTKPVDIKLYFSETAGKTLPKFIKDFINYERYVRALLREYERLAEGKVRLHFIDPLPDSDDAQDATDYGLDGKLINQHGDLFFFGLVFETQTGSRDVIEFLWPEQQGSTEYEISKKLYALLWPAQKRIGILSSLEIFGSADNPFFAQMQARLGRTTQEKWLAVRVLEESYEVHKIPTDTQEIARDEYDLVIVIHPKGLPTNALWALDEWVVRGGNAIVFVDPYTPTDRAPQNPQQPWAALEYRPSSNLTRLLDVWGLERPEDEFAADFELAVRRPVSMRGAAETVIVDLALDAEDHEEALDLSHPILQGPSQLRFLLPGVLRRTGDKSSSIDYDDGDEERAEATGGAAGSLTYTPLITTTSSGGVLTIRPGFGGRDGLFYTDLNDPAKLRDQFAPGTERQVLAYALSGRFESAFPDGADFPADPPAPPPGLPPGVELPPPADAEMIHKDPVLEEEREDAAVVVFADVDFISDQIAFQRNLLGLVQTPNDNHKVLLNSVDFLLGAKELMSVRSKRSIRRPFELFDEIESQAEEDTLERERQIRTDIEAFESQLQEKQNEITQKNAVLFQKKLQDEVDRLNEKIKESNRELREIRNARRARLEDEEASVRISILGWMPSLVLALGLFLSVRRRLKASQAERS